MQATAQLLVRQSLTQWLAGQIVVQSVEVTPGPGGDFSEIAVTIGYVLVETQTLAQTAVVPAGSMVEGRISTSPPSTGPSPR